MGCTSMIFIILMMTKDSNNNNDNDTHDNNDTRDKSNGNDIDNNNTVHNGNNVNNHDGSSHQFPHISSPSLTQKRTDPNKVNQKTIFWALQKQQLPKVISGEIQFDPHKIRLWSCK